MKSKVQEKACQYYYNYSQHNSMCSLHHVDFEIQKLKKYYIAIFSLLNYILGVIHQRMIVLLYFTSVSSEYVVNLNLGLQAEGLSEKLLILTLSCKFIYTLMEFVTNCYEKYITSSGIHSLNTRSKSNLQKKL